MWVHCLSRHLCRRHYPWRGQRAALRTRRRAWDYLMPRNLSPHSICTQDSLMRINSQEEVQLHGAVLAPKPRFTSGISTLGFVWCNLFVKGQKSGRS